MNIVRDIIGCEVNMFWNNRTFICLCVRLLCGVNVSFIRFRIFLLYMVR